MRTPRQFKPSVNDGRLEARLVLSTTSSAFFAPVHTPVVTSAQVTRTLDAIHSDLLSYQKSVTGAILYGESQVTAGNITQATAANLLEGYIGNKTSLLFFQVREAAALLPYGGGFNAYVNSTATAVTDTPSGADSLYAQLTYPSNGSSGPIATLQNNIFTPLYGGDFAGALTAVNTAAIHSTYSSVKTVTNSYVASEVAAHDFTYHK